MSKFGVGVGEDFPVDEKTQQEETPSEQGCHGNGFRFRHGGAHHEQHEAWRRWRQQMHADWRARKHAMREQFRRGQWEAPEAGPAEHDRHRPQPHHFVIGALALIGLAALFGRHHDN